MFIYCFDEQYKNILENSLKLFKETHINNKQCWVFIIDNNIKFNFSEIDRSKCVISNRINF